LTVAAAFVGAPARAQLTELPHVETRGAGDVHVVLVHDVNSDWTVWEEFMERNAERYTMHAVRLPGIAGSKAPTVLGELEEPWLTNAVAAIGWYLGQEALAHPVLIGHGLGGHIALRFGIQYPGKAWKIVTIDGFPAWPLGGPMDVETRRSQAQQMYDQLRRANQDDLLESMERTVRLLTSQPEKWDSIIATMRATPTEVMTRYTFEMLRSDITGRMRRLETPTLAIAPLDTPATVGMDLAEVWEQTVGSRPTADVVLFEDSRHFVMYDEPEALDRAIQQFIAGEAVRPFADEASDEPGDSEAPAPDDEGPGLPPSTEGEGG